MTYEKTSAKNPKHLHSLIKTSSIKSLNKGSLAGEQVTRLDGTLIKQLNENVA